MSQGKKYPYPLAAQWAQKYAELISPFCGILQVVGSVRRHKAECGDIEILCVPIPRTEQDLFGAMNIGATNLLDDGLDGALGKVGATFEKNGPKYKRIKTREGIGLDLFISRPASWDVELVIRTGPAEFSKRCVTPRQQGGYLPSNCRIADGWQVLRGDAVISMQREADFLAFLGLGWVDPWDRHEGLVAGDSILPPGVRP